MTAKYTVINVKGQNLAVRTFIYNDDRSKKTLLMTHGYAMAAPFYVGIIPKLAQHYRIVMFDNLAWGLNSKTDEVGDALESPEKAEAWIVEWWEKLIAALGDDLPPRFYLSAHSLGGYQAMLYACYHPERIEGMFLQSPACVEDQTRDGWVYDPYTVRRGDETADLPSRSEVDKNIQMYADNVHIQDDLHGFPYWMAKGACKSSWVKMMPRRFFSQ